jgi:hypothetical protein
MLSHCTMVEDNALRPRRLFHEEPILSGNKRKRGWSSEGEDEEQEYESDSDTQVPGYGQVRDQQMDGAREHTQDCGALFAQSDSGIILTIDIKVGWPSARGVCAWHWCAL